MSVQSIPQPWNLKGQDVEVKQVIITQLKLWGDGKKNPYTRVYQIWDMEGNLIADFSPKGVDTDE